MSAWRRLLRRRPYALAASGVLVVLMSGDRALVAPPPGVGIDPFEVLDQQTRNNVLIVVDTSTAMKSPVDRDRFTIGADDPASRLFQVKEALRTIIPLNQNRVNFGLATLGVATLEKTVNQTQDNEGDGRIDGPFMYVTADGVTATGLAAATLFHQVAYTNGDDPTTAEDETCSGVPGFFCAISNTFDNYDGGNSADVWRSFMNRSTPTQPNLYNQGYPALCTTAVTAPLSPVNTTAGATRCRFYMQSRLLRDRTRYVWNRGVGDVNARLVATQNIPGGCPVPPAGLLGHTFTPPCFQMQDQATGAIATYYYTSTIYQAQPALTCPASADVNVASPPDEQCENNNIALITSKMSRELPLGDLGPLSNVANHLLGDQTPDAGLRSDQPTSLEATLRGILSAAPPAFPPAQAGTSPKNFVILVTGGDDDCADPTSRDRAAVLAAEAAEALFGGPDPQHIAETVVVAFGSGVNAARANVIAKAGSGALVDGASSDPNTAATCPAGVRCRDAFFASSGQQLTTALTSAIEAAVASGVFSGTPSVFDSIPEYVGTVDAAPLPPFDVMDPDQRYRASAFRSYRALFEAQGFKGMVRGFDEFGPMVAGPRPSPAPTYSRTWEAGQRLMDPDRMSSDLDPTTGTDHTFRDLLGNGTSPVPSGATHIARRIFTTRRNGKILGTSFPDDRAGGSICAGGPCRVNLWPPDAAVVPAAPVATNAGSLDTRLFRKSDGTQMILSELQASPLRACLGANLPTTPVDCTSTNLTTKLIAAQKEAREMILAFTAGAEPRRDASGNPVRNATGEIVYRRRPWVLAESTVGSPAVVTPPLALVPSVHAEEYFLYRDGPRNLDGSAHLGDTDFYIRQGFGLRNPDKDGLEGSGTRTRLKPEMTVVYVPANDMLHAFRAGPCPSGAGSLPCGDESGGEELWAFVPHDLLPKLRDRMKPQTRTDHTFMMAASLRFADVFVPGAMSIPVTGKTYNLTGRWRRVLLFGRGMGGRYYSALDITGLGTITTGALQTQLPVVMWNRGNPDTQDGLTTGTQIGTNTELTAYLDMGMTWSTPAVARVANRFSPEFVAYVGSGYSTGDPREGTRFYTLNPINGDVVDSVNVGDAHNGFQNALVANPVTFAPERLVAGVDLPHPASPVNQFVYVGDIHGRLWKFDSRTPAAAILFRNLGVDHPIGAAAALLNLNAPYVFVETGADARVPAPSGGFRMFAFKDDGVIRQATSLPVPTPDFGLPFPAPPPAGKGDWRGTLQPITAFRGTSAGGEGVVFFTGTRFNPIQDCVSSFDTIVFGLVGKTGGTAYDTTEYTGVKAVGVPRPPVPPAAGGSAPVDQGTSQMGSEPETAPVKPSKVGMPAVVRSEGLRPGSSVCR